MTTSIAFNVNGIPGAQGSKRHVGHGVMVESSKKVKPWRTDVKTAAETAQENLRSFDAWHGPLTGPVRVELLFRFPRPRSHYRTGRHATLLRDDAPSYCISRTHGDLDKLARSTFDALTAAGVLHDDSLVATLDARKRYCDTGESPGAYIGVSAILEAVA